MAIKNHDKKKFSFCHHSADRIAECEIAERRKCRSASTHEKKDVLILPAEWQKKKQRKKKMFSFCQQNEKLRRKEVFILPAE